MHVYTNVASKYFFVFQAALRSPLKGARTKFHTVLTKHELSSWEYPNSWMGKNWKFLLSMNDGPG